MFSELTSIRPGRRLLAVGFQTVAKSNGRSNLQKLDEAIKQILEGKLDGSATIDVSIAVKLLELAYTNIEFENEGDDGRKGHIAALEHLSKTAAELNARGKVFLNGRFRSQRYSTPRGRQAIECSRYKATG